LLFLSVIALKSLSSLNSCFFRGVHLEGGPAAAPKPAASDAPPAAAAPKTRKFASLKREDYRNARAYSGPDAGVPSSLGSSGGDVPLSEAGSVDASSSSSSSEESDVVIHDDAPATPLPIGLDRKKTNYATGRKRYPSLHTRDMGRNSGDREFGDVADILLAQLNTTPAKGDGRPASSKGASSKKKFSSIKKGEYKEGGGEVPLEDSEDASSRAAAKGGLAVPSSDATEGRRDRSQKKKKFGSLRPIDKRGADDEAAAAGPDGEGPKKKYSSMKRDEYKAQSAAFGAIELKDMVAVVKTAAGTAAVAANGEGAPKRRFASMKRENYKSFNQPDGPVDEVEQ
jgi:hypothetical protein